MNWLKRIVPLGLMLAAFSSASAAETARDIFARANQNFSSGNFAEAINGYDAVIKAGSINAVVFYDLGNAWFRSGDFGRAILNYERALALEPHHPEAEANLRVARDEARALELSQTTVERYLSAVSTNHYVIAAAAFWISIFIATAMLYSSRSRFGRTLMLLLAFAAFIATTYAAYARETGSKGRDLAIVIAKETPARVATADNSKSVLTLPAGSEIKILSRRGDWAYAALPNELRGWIPTHAAEAVRL